MGYCVTTPEREKVRQKKLTCTQKTASREIFSYSIKTSQENRFQSPELHQGNRLTTTKIASGIPYWPSRDPIEERGGYNIYCTINNDLISKFDVLGLSLLANAEAYKACKEAQKKTTEDRQRGGDREYCGLICCNKLNGNKSRTEPHSGITRRIDARTTVNSCNPLRKGDCRRIKGREWITVGTYHSHSHGERFSGGDYRATVSRTERAGRNIPNYLGTPNGKVCKLVVDPKIDIGDGFGTRGFPGTGRITEINEDGSEGNPQQFPYSQ